MRERRSTSRRSKVRSGARRGGGETTTTVAMAMAVVGWSVVGEDSKPKTQGKKQSSGVKRRLVDTWVLSRLGREVGTVMGDIQVPAAS